MIRRALLALAAVLAAATAQAQQCIDQTAVWSVPYSQGSIQVISYFVWQQQPSPPPTLFTVLYRSGEYHIHQAVPQSVAQRFTGLTNADTTYQQFVQNAYRQLLISEDNCPLLNETGALNLLGERP